MMAATMPFVERIGFDRMLRNPFMNAAVSFTEPFPVGLLVTLISAAVLKRKSP